MAFEDSLVDDYRVPLKLTIICHLKLVAELEPGRQHGGWQMSPESTAAQIPVHQQCQSTNMMLFV